MSVTRHLLFIALLAITPMLAQSAGAEPVPDLHIEEVYARAVPPGQPNSAAFLQIRNASDQDRALIDASSPVAEVVELHTHVQDQGVMRMRRVERIDVPAHSTTVLQPGGLHLMLIGLKQPLAVGDPLALRLVFDQDEVVEVQAVTRSIMPPHGAMTD